MCDTVRGVQHRACANVSFVVSPEQDHIFEQRDNTFCWESPLSFVMEPDSKHLGSAIHKSLL